ncbi:MAG TPA: MarR family transcriptional regulator [Fibrobacteria bacterium]|nr:MarR family transcriptional regulator [Fibrobacteria bacterium]
MDPNRCSTKQARKRLDCWLQMIRTYDQMQGEVAAQLQRHGLTLPQFEVLSSLAVSSCTNQQELARRLQVTKGNLVGLIDRLAERGWVERHPDPEDRRVNRVRITEPGKALMEKVYPDQLAAVEAMMAKLGLDEVDALRSLLKKLDAAI